MRKYVAKRVRFRNGERLSVLQVKGGLPVHEVTLFLDRYRRRGRSANTIHSVCAVLALLYQELDRAGINLIERLEQGRFLTLPELDRLAAVAQLRVEDMEDSEPASSPRQNVVNIARIRLRRTAPQQQKEPVGSATVADRLRCIAAFLQFRADYVAAGLPPATRKELEHEATRALRSFRAQSPPASKRAKIGARVGLSEEEEARLLETVRPGSPTNPWSREYVQKRNWLIVVVLLATGMRRGELLGLQIGELAAQQSKLSILRRADTRDDPRLLPPYSKTSERMLELRPAIMRELWGYISKDRHQIKAARAFPQIFVADDGMPLSLSSIDKLFLQLRAACPGLPGKLTSHVMRHTWNERFSEQADALGLSAAEEEKARNSQQGWSEGSKMANTYLRRHAELKGREVSLKLQESLDEKLKPRK